VSPASVIVADSTFSMPTMPRLIYFDIPGRGEVARLCLWLSNTEFENVTFAMADWQNPSHCWNAVYKKLSPTGQVSA
jgi:hypothetical protein